MRFDPKLYGKVMFAIVYAKRIYPPAKCALAVKHAYFASSDLRELKKKRHIHYGRDVVCYRPAPKYHRSIEDINFTYMCSVVDLDRICTAKFMQGKVELLIRYGSDFEPMDVIDLEDRRMIIRDERKKQTVYLPSVVNYTQFFNAGRFGENMPLPELPIFNSKVQTKYPGYNRRNLHKGGDKELRGKDVRLTQPIN